MQKTENTFWFKHDYHARDDKKITRFLMKFGMEGYGIFMAILEDMAKESYTNIKRSDIDILSHNYSIPIDTLETVINYLIELGIFIENEGKDLFFNKRMIDHKQNRLEKALSKSLAGKKGAAIRWGKDGKDGTAIAYPMQRGEERRGEERKREEKENENSSPLSEEKNGIPEHELTETEIEFAIRQKKEAPCSLDDVKIFYKNLFLGDMDKVKVFQIAEEWYLKKQADGFPKNSWKASAKQYYNQFSLYGRHRQNGADLKTGNSNAPATKAIEITFCDKCWGTTENKKRGEDFCSCNLNNHPNIPAFRKNHHHIIFLKPDETFDEWKVENFDETKQTELEYFFCNVCGRYSVNYGEDFCSCLQNLNKKEKPDFIQKHHKIVSVPKTENFEEWGKKHIEQKGEVFVIS